MSNLMDRVWEAYWQPEPHGTEAALHRVVALVLNEAAGVADDAAHSFETCLKGKHGRPLSEFDEGLFESAMSAAIEIAKNIRSIAPDAALNGEG